MLKTLHDRMPVILHPEDYDRWLEPGGPQESAARSAGAGPRRAHKGLAHQACNCGVVFQIVQEHN